MVEESPAASEASERRLTRTAQDVTQNLMLLRAHALRLLPTLIHSGFAHRNPIGRREPETSGHREMDIKVRGVCRL